MKKITMFMVALVAQPYVAFATDYVALLKPPTQPKYESCNAGDSACVGRNESLNKQYLTDLSAYNQAKLQEASSARDNSLKQLTSQTNNSGAGGAKDLIEEVEGKNKKGSVIFKIASMACMVTSGVFAVKAATATLPPKKLEYGIKAAVFMAFSMLAKSQSKSHNSVAQAACNSANQLSTTQKNCNYSPDDPSYGPGSVASVTDAFNSDGSCATVQATCDAITANLPAGVNIKDGLAGISAFASNLKNTGIKNNPDGSITLPNGKTLKPDQFTNAQALQDAGLSPVAAGQLASDLKNNPFGNAGGEVQVVNAKDPKNPLSGTYGTSTISASGSGSGSGANADKGGGVLSEGATIAGANGVGAGDRNLASDGSEGLVKDFNGELIGTSSEDIFKKINRRYNLKSDQNSFLDQ